MATINGTPDDDVRNGTTGDDVFNLAQGGEDTASGNDGNDSFYMAGALDAGDRIDGGTGTDTVVLSGDYSAGLVFGADTITSVEKLRVAAGFSYQLIMNDGNVAPGERLSINASALGAGNSLIFDGSAELDGAFTVYGGAGNDTITGGAQADNIHLEMGGRDTVNADDGDDRIWMGNSLTAADHINGGAGYDTVYLDGLAVDSVAFANNTMTGIERLVLRGGHDYILATADGTVAAGDVLTVDASSMGAGDTLYFNGAAETDGSFYFIGGTAVSEFVGGQNSDLFNLTHGGSVTAVGNGGDDLFLMGGTLNAGDSIDGGHGWDIVVLNGDYGGGLTLGADTITNVEQLELTAGHDYTITTNDGNVAAGDFMLIDGSYLRSSDVLVFDGSAETDGAFAIAGGRGSNVLETGAGDDQFLLGNGGSYTIHSGGGDDTFTDKAAQLALATIDGGSGYDVLQLAGSTAGLSFDASRLAGVNEVDFGTYGVFRAATVTGDITNGEGVLTLDASRSRVLDVDLSQATSSGYNLLGGTNGDTFTFGGNFSSSDTIDGGTGANRLVLNGDYTGGNALVLDPANITRVQTIQLLGSHSYDITTGDGFGGKRLFTLDAGALGTADALYFDSSNDMSSSYNVIGGAGNDTIILGSNSTTSSARTIVVSGGAGADTIDFSSAGPNSLSTYTADYSSPSESTSTGFDTLANFAVGGLETVQLGFIPGAVNLVSGGTLDAANFDSELASLVNSGFSAPYSAVVLDGATYQGSSMAFLVVDANGDMAYTPGTDYVFAIPNHGAISLASFT